MKEKQGPIQVLNYKITKDNIKNQEKTPGNLLPSEDNQS